MRQNETHAKFRKTGERAAALTLALALSGVPAFAQTAQNPTPPNGQSVGALELPKTPPPTSQQAPLPNPVQKTGKADRPALLSPTLKDLSVALTQHPLTINEAVSVALATNRSLALAGAALLRAEGRTGELRTSFVPTVAATFQYLRLNQGSTGNIGGVPITFTNEQQRSIGVNASLPIDISGQLRAAVDQAKYQEIASRLDVNRVRNELVVNVKSAFYDVLRAEAQVAVQTDNLQNSLDRLDDAQKKFIAGTVARFDVIRAQTDVLNAQQQLIQARNTVSNSIATLNNTIGIDVNTPLKITSDGALETPPGVAPPADLSQAPPVGTYMPSQPARDPNQIDPLRDPTSRIGTVALDTLELGPDYDRVLKEALATRAEILQSDATLSASRKGIVLARRGIVPSLNVTYGFSYTPDVSGFTPQTDNGQAALQLSVPLFDGGVTRERVRQARADVATAEINRRTSIDGVTLDVRQAYLNLLQNRDRVAVTNQALAQAREAFRLARVRYNAGVTSAAGASPILEVSDAQNALTLAESNQVNALYDYNNTRARLDRAIGRYAYTTTGYGYTAPPSARITGTPNIAPTENMSGGSNGTNSNSGERK